MKTRREGCAGSGGFTIPGLPLILHNREKTKLNVSVFSLLFGQKQLKIPAVGKAADGVSFQYLTSVVVLGPCESEVFFFLQPSTPWRRGWRVVTGQHDWNLSVAAAASDTFETWRSADILFRS